VARIAGFTLQNSVLWVKSMSPDLESAEPVEGHVKTLNSTRFLNDAWEYIFHLTPLGKTPIDKLAVGVRYADESNLKRGTRGKNGNVRCAGNVWLLPYETIQHRDTDRPHPATFPVSLPERCLRLHGLKRAGRVIDPFCGLGTTAVACHRLGLEFEGWELDAEYAALARERVTREAQAEAMVQPSLAFA
jgi:site-specific DNA-methyltransferase (adenine-specific)